MSFDDLKKCKWYVYAIILLCIIGFVYPSNVKTMVYINATNITGYGFASQSTNNITNVSEIDGITWYGKEDGGRWEVYYNFTNISSFDYLESIYKYNTTSGTSNHDVFLEVYCYKVNRWVSMQKVFFEDRYTYSTRVIAWDGEHNFVSSTGNVSVRIYHESTPGNTNHAIWVDLMRLVVVTSESAAVSAPSQSVTNNIISNVNQNMTNISAHGIARAYLSSDQNNLVSGVYTVVLLDTESYDPFGEFNTATNTYIAPKSGYYVVSASILFNQLVSPAAYSVSFWVNGVRVSLTQNAPTTNAGLSMSDIIYMNEGDSLQLRARSGAGVNTVDVLGGSDLSWMSVKLVL